MVPVTKIMTDDIKNNGPLPIINALSGTPRALRPNRYAGAWTIQIAIVNHLVI